MRGASSSATAVTAAGGAASDTTQNPPLQGCGNNEGHRVGVGLPESQQSHLQVTRNPNLLREVMNMPAAQSLMNNPDLMRNMIMSNPQMREIIDRNPSLAHILNDSGTLRQTLEAARNPELMREMMRNTDRAMSNIESSPEGFNMLRRMYETVQEPFLNAATLGADVSNDMASSPFTALLGGHGSGSEQNQNLNSNGTVLNSTNMQAPNTAPLPNPWDPSQNRASASRQTNAAARLNINSSRLGGFTGSGLADSEAFGGGMGTGDSSGMQHLLQNPAISQMMQGLLSNPEFINQIMNLQPRLREMLNSNPQLREMLQNPEFLRQSSSPESLMQVLQLQRAGIPLRNSPTPEANGAVGANNVDLTSLLSIFGAFGGVPSTTPEVNTVPPEQLYASQLSQLQEMGFVDIEANIRALSATQGNVHAAVERLLGNLG